MRIAAALFITLFAATTIISCSEKAEDIVAEPEPEPQPEVIEPKPDWADNEMTLAIKVKTAEDLLSDLKKGGYTFTNRIRRALLDPEDPPPLTSKPYTTVVTVVTMKEIGIERALMLPEIKERYQELGYRLLTLQEAVELRLHLHDQPNVTSGHRWSAFFGLTESAKSDKLSGGKNMNIVTHIFNASFRDSASKKALFRHWHYDNRFSPASSDPLKLNLLRVIPFRDNYGARFAVIKGGRNIIK